MTDRLTVVLGASRGIGRHLAKRAAANGDDVLLVARDGDALDQLATELTDHAKTVRVIAADVLSGQGLAEIEAALKAHSGRVSVFLTAAVIGPPGRIVDTDPDMWAQALNTNVVGTMRVMQRVHPVLSERDLAVVFSGGGVGGRNIQPRVSSYTTSKLALCHLVELLAREAPAAAGTVVAIAPGPFPTDFTRALLDQPLDVLGEALFNDITKNQQSDFDASRLDALLDHLETNDVRWLSGRTISARWETPEVLTALVDERGSDPDLFRIRRVDGDAVVSNQR